LHLPLQAFLLYLLGLPFEVRALQRVLLALACFFGLDLRALRLLDLAACGVAALRAVEVGPRAGPDLRHLRGL